MCRSRSTRKQRRASSIVFPPAALVVLLVCAGLPVAQAEDDPAAGRLEITAAVVTRDLQVRPVPKFRFLVRGDAADPVAEVVTGFDGTASLDLAPGSYRLVSADPLEWEGEAWTWNVPFEVAPGEPTRLELSGDNAARSEAARAGKVTPEARLYERSRGSVFLVSADAGVGSGFLVDPSGLILTNYHVVARARYVAVLVSRGHKVPAVQLAADPDQDVAVLRVHPDAVSGLTALPLLADRSMVVVGERVVAIGNPLAQESVLTSGIVSKIDDDAIISDVNINPGNSGGPLLNLDGEVVGINTFSLQDSAGPGVSGTIRIHVADGALEQARGALDGSEPPPNELLPTVSETRFPADRLRAMLTAEPNMPAYEVEAGPFDVTFFTPPLLHSLSVADDLRAAERQKKRIEKKKKKKKQKQEEQVVGEDPAPIEVHDPAELLFAWAEQSGVLDAVVIVRVMPEVAMTGGSKTGRIFGAMFGVVTRANYRFKRDFREMRLTRDGEPIRPIHPGRVCETVSMEGAYAKIEDVGCYGQYLYDPAVFRSGTSFTLEVFAEDAPDTPEAFQVSPGTIAKIRADFAPYFEAAQTESP